MRSYALSALSGLLLAASFPLFGWDFMAWWALVPLFFAMQGRTPAQCALYGLTLGAVFYMVGMSWVTNTLINYGHIPAWLSWLILGLLAAYLSLYTGLFGYLLQRISRGNAVIFFLLAAPLWTALEFIRSLHSVFGFTWLGLGYSQSEKLPVIQIAELTGVYGVTAFIVLVNAGLFYVLNPAYTHHPHLSKFRWPVAFATVTSMIVVLGWGFLNTPLEKGGDLKVALVQGNIKQEMKWNPVYRNQIMDRYVLLTEKTAQEQPDLVVWPEAVTPFYFELDDTGTRQVREAVAQSGAPLLFGSPYLEDQGSLLGFVGEKKKVLLNSAFYLNAQGETQGRYDKIHLVPFGEYVPYRAVLSFVDKLVVGMTDFGTGKEFTLFDLKGRKFGVSICFEITLPDLVRQPVKKGATFLVNITNDAWFGKSAASYQHIQMAALRAVENRVPIVRAANTGITGVIEANGNIKSATDIFVDDVLVDTIQPSKSTPTFYSQFGDVFAYLCMGIVVVLNFLARVSKQRVDDGIQEVP